MNLVSITISSLIMNIVQIYSYFKISKTDINFRSPKVYLLYLFQTFLIIVNYMYNINLLKVMCTFAIMIITCKLLLNDKKFINCFIISLISELVIIISEVCFAVVASIISKVDNKILVEIFQGTIFANTIIVIISYLILLTKLPNKIYNKLKILVENISKNKVIILFMFVIFCAAVLFYVSYYNDNKLVALIINFTITTIYFLIVIMNLMKEHKYNVIHSKYLTTLKELEEYENIINEYRIINHENKNQLLSIRGMTSSKKAQEYIDEILDNKTKSNENILKQALLIPAGGLRGLIYSKMLIMKNNNINCYLNIDKQINSKVMKNITTKTMLDVCQIVGVYLDNSIEEVKDLNKKEIMINIYIDENINIEIINTINKLFDISKIDKVGYTTKKGAHGYGLPLVSRILKNNDNLSNERTINSNIFKQKLIIKKS